MFFIFNSMALRIALLLFLASHLSISVMSTRSFTVENKCDYTVWPATFNYQGSVDTTGFILEKGETRTINTTSSWIGNLWGRSRYVPQTQPAISHVSRETAAPVIWNAPMLASLPQL